MTARTFDVQTADRLSVLIAQARDSTLNLNLDYCSLRPPESAFILQLFDVKERDIMTARGRTLAQAVEDLHNRWLAKALPG